MGPSANRTAPQTLSSLPVEEGPQSHQGFPPLDALAFRHVAGRCSHKDVGPAAQPLPVLALTCDKQRSPAFQAGPRAFCSQNVAATT